MTLYHTTRRTNHTSHIGMCLTDDRGANYGRRLYAAELPAGLVVRSVRPVADAYDTQTWPGDTEEECAALAADGVDVIRYDGDADERGREHTTYRLVSAAAVAAVVLVDVTEED